MANCQTENQLIQMLANKDALCYPLLRWILMSNRAHLAPIPDAQQIPAMKTPFQFVMVSDNPKKELRFRKKRAKKGSFYAFHGSFIGNWHAIFRVGLKNYSNTKKMSAGAAYGPGIYLAKHSSTSFGYVSPGPGWDKSEISTNIACIAMVEVIDERSMGRMGSIKTASNGSIYVVRDEDLIITRFFFLYPQGRYTYKGEQRVGQQHTTVSVDADTVQVPESIYNEEKAKKLAKKNGNETTPLV
mmetsp:Transcript_19008/g.21175  ORF Transcript_19008/g.21175 Transcript_19008/m.21175 type:complete len:243 (+) Transcript_19008:3-731(+)